MTGHDQLFDGLDVQSLMNKSSSWNFIFCSIDWVDDARRDQRWETFTGCFPVKHCEKNILQPMPRRTKLVFVNLTSQKHFCLKGRTEIVFKLSYVRITNVLQYYVSKFSQGLKKGIMKWKAMRKWTLELESAGRKTCPLSTRSCALAISILKSKAVQLKIMDINLLLDFLVEGAK